MRPSPRSGFTLVEILVAVSIIALLLGVLVPVLGSVRGAAKSAGCAAMQRNLFMGVQNYANSNSDNLPGINTTGRKYLGSLGATTHIPEMLFDSSPNTPTQTFDWISPSIGLDANLDRNRARRTKQIFEDLGCPSAGAFNDKLYGFATDKTPDFQTLIDSEGIGQISYLSPGPFHLVGPAPPGAGTGRRYGWSGPAIPPQSYLPRLDRVGTQLSGKIFIADGTRYLTKGGILDFDISPSPKYYGSFTSSSPIYSGSTAYGREPHHPQFNSERHESRSTYPYNKNLSYRHGGGINVTFLDGHVDGLSEAESKSDATRWYPRGSIFTGIRASRESLLHHKIDDIFW